MDEKRGEDTSASRHSASRSSIAAQRFACIASQLSSGGSKLPVQDGRCIGRVAMRMALDTQISTRIAAMVEEEIATLPHEEFSEDASTGATEASGWACVERQHTASSTPSFNGERDTSHGLVHDDSLCVSATSSFVDVGSDFVPMSHDYRRNFRSNLSGDTSTVESSGKNSGDSHTPVLRRMTTDEEFEEIFSLPFRKIDSNASVAGSSVPTSPSNGLISSPPHRVLRPPIGRLPHNATVQCAGIPRASSSRGVSSHEVMSPRIAGFHQGASEKHHPARISDGGTLVSCSSEDTAPSMDDAFSAVMYSARHSTAFSAVHAMHSVASTFLSNVWDLLWGDLLADGGTESRGSRSTDTIISRVPIEDHHALLNQFVSASAMLINAAIIYSLFNRTSVTDAIDSTVHMIQNAFLKYLV